MIIMMNHALEQRNEQNKNIRGGGEGGEVVKDKKNVQGPRD